MLDGEAARDTQRHHDLSRRAVHGIGVAEVDNGGLIPEVLERHVCQVKVYALHQDVCGYEYACVRVRQFGGIIAYAAYCGGVLVYNAFSDFVYKAEFAQRGYFCLFFFRSAMFLELWWGRFCAFYVWKENGRVLIL